VAEGETTHGGEAVERTVSDVGRRIRDAREASGMTLRTVSGASGLSTSMLSLVERGRTSPSIGTLVSICDALSLPLASLFSGSQDGGARLIPRAETPTRSKGGTKRRVIVDDRRHGMELSEELYAPGAASGEAPLDDSGEEFGVVVTGRLDVEVDGTTYRLGDGDAVRFATRSPHRAANRGRGTARAIWVTIRPR
jgi:transcriptional regulator with XRE-family HTH domain